MALIYSHGTQKPSDMTVPCWVCSGLISRRAEKCPHCGHPDPVEESVRRFEERSQRQQDAAIETRKVIRFNVVIWAIILGIWPIIWLVMSVVT